MPTDPRTDTTLILKRTIPAPRTAVFDAWTNPEQMRQWFCPDETFSVAIAEVDLKVGGAFRIGMRHANNELSIANGIYREIRRPERLVFTWTWEHHAVETLVTLTFIDLGTETEIILKHELLPSREERDDHADGWSGCLGQLAKFVLHVPGAS